MQQKAPRPKKCEVCREVFQPLNRFQKACGVPCSIEHAKAKQRKKWAQEAREYRQRNETKPQLLKKAQQAFNAYVRIRDHGQPCISCGYSGDARHLTGSEWDAGHYRSVGSAPELRFEELNCHRQCVKCNQHLSGNTVAYRQGLLERIGTEKVEWLEGPHPAKQYTHQELRDLAAHYRAKTRELKKQIESK